MELKPSLETLVTEINTINRAWKQSSEVLLDSNAGLSTSLRDLKSSLQVRLLRNYPQQVYLIPDDETESEEPLYSIRLREAVAKYGNAAHIPVRVAEEMLTPEELTQFVERNDT